jgi:hypothetical protein
MSRVHGEITGKVHFIAPTQMVGKEANVAVRKVVLEVATDLNDQLIPIDFVQNRASLVNDLRVGEKVMIGYNLKGFQTMRDGKKNFYSSIEGLHLDKM